MRSEAKIWSAAAAGPFAWFGVLVASYALTPDAYTEGSNSLLTILHVIAIAIAVGGGVIALSEYRRLRAVQSEEDITERARFVAMFALGLALLSIVVLIGSSLPTLLLPAGAEP
jgi:FtsH-binding integral membrane protein